MFNQLPSRWIQESLESRVYIQDLCQPHDHPLSRGQLWLIINSSVFLNPIELDLGMTHLIGCRITH